jgi:formyltetrahydrofolate deformylase
LTAELDAGPIIEQDAIRISDRDDLEAVTRVGADLERLVLARLWRGTAKTGSS